MRCSVGEHLEQPGLHHVDLALTHGPLKQFAVSGWVAEPMDNVVTLHVTTADSVTFNGHCIARDIRGLPERVRFFLTNCGGTFSDPALAACNLEATGVFEHCTK